MTVKEILGHKQVETTLVYTRLYAPTVASHYYRATAQIEGQLQDGDTAPAPDPGMLLALVDTLHTGTLNATQQATVQALRDGIRALVAQETTVFDTPIA